jgi:hypothetical protein
MDRQCFSNCEIDTASDLPISPDGEAKFWLDPQIELAVNKGLGSVELTEIRRVIEERHDEIRESWRRHFGS